MRYDFEVYECQECGSCYRMGQFENYDFEPGDDLCAPCTKKKLDQDAVLE